MHPVRLPESRSRPVAGLGEAGSVQGGWKRGAKEQAAGRLRGSWSKEGGRKRGARCKGQG